MNQLSHKIFHLLIDEYLNTTVLPLILKNSMSPVNNQIQDNDLLDYKIQHVIVVNLNKSYIMIHKLQH